MVGGVDGEEEKGREVMMLMMMEMLDSGRRVDV